MKHMFHAGLIWCCCAAGVLFADGLTWPGGRVPYVITNGAPWLEAALRQFHLQLAGVVEFVPRTAEPDYVNFNFDAGNHSGVCSSSVGRMGGEQVIGGSADCTAEELLGALARAIGDSGERFDGQFSAATLDHFRRLYRQIPVETARTRNTAAAVPQTAASGCSLNPPASMVILGPNPQSALVGAMFGYPFYVTLKDSSGNYVNCVTVSFSAPSSGPSATLSTAGGSNVTTIQGAASARGTANSIAGSYQIKATAGTLSAIFTVSNVTGNFASGPCVVTSGADDNTPGTLRYQVATCGKGGTITFSQPAAAAVTLGGHDVQVVYNNLTIDGGSATSISGGGRSRIFYISPGGNLTLKNITLKNGLAKGGNGGRGAAGGGGAGPGLGGAVYVDAKGLCCAGGLTASNVTFLNNVAQGGSGGSGSGLSGYGGGGGGPEGNGDDSTSIQSGNAGGDGDLGFSSWAGWGDTQPPGGSPNTSAQEIAGGGGGAGTVSGGVGTGRIFGGNGKGTTGGGGGGLGGAIYAVDLGPLDDPATVSLGGVTFSGNSASGGTGGNAGQGKGGAIYARAIYSSGATFTGNLAMDAGIHTACSTVLGAGALDSNDLCSGPIAYYPDLVTTVSHAGNFTRGQIGATFTITVSNNGLAPASSGTFFVTDTLPSGLTATAMTGSGWSCSLAPTLQCFRAGTLAPGTGFPSITLTVNVANNAPASVVNTASVSGVAEINTDNNTANDTTLINQNQPPTADSVTGIAPGSLNQSLTFKYSSPGGSTYLADVYALFNSSLNGVNACWVAYDKAANGFYLVTDSGGGLLGPLALGSNLTLHNTQCTLNGTGSSVSGSGNTLTMTLNLTFSNPFGAAQTIFMYALDAGGLNSGWQNRGTTGASTPPTADSVSGISPGSLNQTVALKYSSANGYGYLADVFVLFNSSLNGVNACWVAYDKGTNAFYLVNDSYTGSLGPLAVGSNLTLQNSQCTLNGTGSSVSGSANTLTMTLNLSFANTFGAAQIIFMYAADAGGLNSGWQNRGTTAASTPPTADSAAVSAPGSMTQSVTLKYSSVNGSGYLTDVYALFNSALNGVNACWVAYDKAVNGFYLVNDSYSGVLGPLAVGSNLTLQNTQCTLNGSGSTVSGSGNTLTMVLSLTFNHSFAGTQQIFMYAADQGGQNSGWQNRGTVTVP